MKIAHIVNPVNNLKNSDLEIAQPYTFDSMVRAKNSITTDLLVDFVGVGFESDLQILPDDFQIRGLLTRTVQDLGCFSSSRKLPLLKDILDVGVALTDADYIVYTNVDIACMPFFYEYIADAVNYNDGLVINRRTIPTLDRTGIPLSQLFSQVGDAHPGYDCFIFPKKIYSNFILGSACIGANFIGKIVLANMFLHCDTPVIVKDRHLTFHIGDDQVWKKGDGNQYAEHNLGELRASFAALRARYGNSSILDDLQARAAGTRTPSTFRRIFGKT